ncbi:MAG: hypothetical protein ABIK09_05585 [Pseudomonadota bacterium]
MSQLDKDMERRRKERVRRIVTNIAWSYEEARAWDLGFWQARTPEERINALEELRADRHNIGHASH